MTTYEIISLIISILSLGATASISFAIYCLEKTSERKMIKQINKERAKDFIIDHDSEIEFIPLCLIASCLNRHHQHHRNMYNDFNKLSNDVQNEVLKQLNYECGLILDNEWMNEGIEFVRQFILNNQLSTTGDFLYDGAKYFHRAFNEYSGEEYDSINIYSKKYEDVFGWESSRFANNNLGKGILSFRNYFQAYMDKVIIQKDSNYLDATPPITYLINIENFHSCPKEENLCYWIMEMLSVISAYIINTTNKKWILNTGDAFPVTFEDRYYEVLINLYNLTH